MTIAFAIQYDDLNGAFNGSLSDRENDGISFLNLCVSINLLLVNHYNGILRVTGIVLGLMYYDNMFYFTGFHMNGSKGRSENGKACLIECDTIHNPRGTVYSNAGIIFLVN